MNKENVDFLKERLFFLGFGTNLHADLEKKIADKQEKFDLTFQAEFQNGSKMSIVDYTLDVTKSKQNDMYFLNNYTATLNPENPDQSVSHKFYLNKGSGVTAKEAFNMLEGRAVFMDKLENKEGEKYKAWLQIDFSKKDDKGNFKVQQYHEAWKYDLDKLLSKQPIKELENATLKERLVNSLEKGNIAPATFVRDGKEEKMFLEANPKDRNLTIYDQDMHKQGQGVRRHQPQVSEGQENNRSNTNDQSQGVGGPGASQNGKSQSSLSEGKQTEKADNLQEAGAEKKSTDQTKSEKRGFETDSPTRTRPKKKGMSV